MVSEPLIFMKEDIWCCMVSCYWDVDKLLKINFTNQLMPIKLKDTLIVWKKFRRDMK